MLQVENAGWRWLDRELVACTEVSRPAHTVRIEPEEHELHLRVASNRVFRGRERGLQMLLNGQRADLHQATEQHELESTTYTLNAMEGTQAYNWRFRVGITISN